MSGKTEAKKTFFGGYLQIFVMAAVHLPLLAWVINNWLAVFPLILRFYHLLNEFSQGWYYQIDFYPRSLITFQAMASGRTTKNNTVTYFSFCCFLFWQLTLTWGTVSACPWLQWLSLDTIMTESSMLAWVKKYVPSSFRFYFSFCLVLFHSCFLHFWISVSVYLLYFLLSFLR